MQTYTTIDSIGSSTTTTDEIIDLTSWQAVAVDNDTAFTQRKCARAPESAPPLQSLWSYLIPLIGPWAP